MALKENIDAIKQELSAQEKMLENIIMSERFFKRNKRAIMVAVIVLLLAILGYVGLKAVRLSNMEASNEAYKALYANPNDENALNVLRNKNKPLYRAFVFKNALKNGDNQTLKSLIAENEDDVISAIAAYYTSSNASADMDIFRNLTALEEGFALIKEGKADEASVKFLSIPADSALMGFVRSLDHYKISAKESE